MSNRIFDVEFGELNQSVSRLAATLTPATVTYLGPGSDDILYEDEQGGVVLYKMLDLSQLTQEGRIFQPTSVNIQRPYDAPAGSKFNPNIAVQTEEYIFIVYSPVLNPDDPDLSTAAKIANVSSFRQAGFDTSSIAIATNSGDNEICNAQQVLFAQSSFYAVDLAHSLTPANLGLAPILPPANTNVLLSNSMALVERNQYGSMGPVMGPRLHCFRVIIARDQNLTGLSPLSPTVTAIGLNAMKYSPLNIRIMTSEVSMSDGNYIIAASNELTSMTPELRG